MVFAWPEPPDATFAGKPAGARCGAPGTFARGGNEPAAEAHVLDERHPLDLSLAAHVGDLALRRPQAHPTGHVLVTSVSTSLHSIQAPSCERIGGAASAWRRTAVRGPIQLILGARSARVAEGGRALPDQWLSLLDNGNPMNQEARQLCALEADMVVRRSEFASIEGNCHFRKRRKNPS
jgi:hypothetical protein